MDLTQISSLYNAHCDRVFPSGIRGAEINGIDLVMLDADTVGIVDRFLGKRHNIGRLDRRWYLVLMELQVEAEKVLQGIPENAKEYYQEIRLLIELTLKYLDENPNCVKVDDSA